MRESTRPDEREAAITALRRGEVNVLFAADLFNEGLDIPEVDTVLFLRPTQRATGFLQQLGRGLGRAASKAVLTVLDFIGQHRREFRFDVRYRALTGASRRGLESQIEQGFPFLPSGSQVVLSPEPNSPPMSVRMVISRWASTSRKPGANCRRVQVQWLVDSELFLLGVAEQHVHRFSGRAAVLASS
ncbi:MAG: helicase-related protein [Haloechinothrix sp.]